jgi:hypothetical protein
LLQMLSELLAEPIEARGVRAAGKPTENQPLPAWPEAQSSCTGGTC